MKNLLAPLPNLIRSFSVGLLAFSPVFAMAQQSPFCDSVFINCCDVVTGPDEITLTADNHSAYLFDYPAFQLIASNGDTVAHEITNYFGIGFGPQLHSMELLMPITFPFTGTLELYTGFYDTLWCSWQVTITDSTVSIYEPTEISLSMFPNPADDKVQILVGTDEPFNIELFDMNGRLVYTEQHVRSGATVATSHLPAGLYIVSVGDGTFMTREKFMVR
jgi:hypothetical protein